MTACPHGCPHDVDHCDVFHFCARRAEHVESAIDAAGDLAAAICVWEHPRIFPPGDVEGAIVDACEAASRERVRWALAATAMLRELLR